YKYRLKEEGEKNCILSLMKDMSLGVGNCFLLQFVTTILEKSVFWVKMNLNCFITVMGYMIFQRKNILMIPESFWIF
ncbi:MAG: hypothetical protein K2H19_05985, partial [Ruminococcus sp.]|nr:hypothetical protein [Ruminococcus sp.]